ncbi:hypothetical protein GCM10011376_02790 [Nocardioides flavus (ex Wang et al. 2016)]|uniref:PQQ-like domain-containing protein n=1 Tax=Nocardioides flavus (ex Wang et al. 2016) TaxID=2058780 RepID=A0ABQ3HG19_9ACTN|nr:PQQ-binding-like beta-propeller repeat protein [Nocardioides flavus (ex Wang et al. 2016)]GHE15286.1 hypothetical protein GCM10011376_02790 [Nocardioides flavus (ex Wang et al. 2016)]
MVWLVGALALLWVSLGPVVVLLAAALLCVPQVRWWVQDRAYVSRRAAAGTAATVAVVAAVVVVVPDGWLPIPPAPGVRSGPSYVGRPASPHPVQVAEARQNPHRVAGPPTARPGPLGHQPQVDTAWYGLQRCGRLEPISTGHLVALCTSGSGRSVRLVDPESLRPVATQELPDLPDDTDDGGSCDGDAGYVDATDRAVVASGDRRVLAVRTATEGEPGLATADEWDLKPYVPHRDCLVSVAPDWSGRIWWVSRAGLVGTVDPATGQVGVTDLAEEVARDLTTDEGGAYVVTEEALHRLALGADGTPQPVWRTEYAGSSGSAPVLLDGGVVAITDEVDGRLGVLLVAGADGRQVCRQSVFEEGDGSTDSDLAPLGTGVAVVNNDGYSSPGSTLLGFTSQPGIARVDLVDGACVLAWTSDAVSPASGVVASHANGLLYAWTKRPSLVGVSAWYLTALDADTGRNRWSVRTGTGLLAGSDGSRITLDRDGAAWIGTLAGLVRVRDRSR